MSDLDALIATMNNLDVGPLDKLTEKLDTVREKLHARGLSDLVDKVSECERALLGGELQEFRRLRETVVSRLGHLRVQER